MSKIIYVCFRDKTINSSTKERINKICEELNPDNISAHPTKVGGSNKVVFGISNPVSSFSIKDSNVLLGSIFEEGSNWEKKANDIPDGNFVIFKTREEDIEIITDCIGSRSVWYYQDKEKLIASTSQKAIIKFLGDFQFDERVIPWVISTGMLGPEYCWDRRLKKIPSDGRLFLDRSSWTVKINSKPVSFRPVRLPKKKHKEKLTKAIQSTFKNISINPTNWRITLSGGHDSRAILLLLKKFGKNLNSRYKTITWGTKTSIHSKYSDAAIAEKLAKNQNTVHNYYSNEDSDEPLDKIINRFLNNGEGRIDHITGYLDGFKIWKNIYEDGALGVIRGDEVFGYNKLFSPLAVNNFMGLTLCSDFSNLQKFSYIKSLHQEKPKELNKKKNESLSTWRDRIFQMYRIPYAQAALADLKYPYVEQINPFLSKRIVTIIRQLPDHLRTNKKLFKMIMKPMNPNIPFSKSDSNVLLKNALKRKDIVSLIKKELLSDYAQTIFPNAFLNQVVNSLETITLNNNEKKGIVKRIKSFFPKKLKAFFLPKQKNSLTLDENILGFRIFIICRMHRILEEDSDS